MSKEPVRRRSVSALGRRKEAIPTCSVARSRFDPTCGCLWAGQVVRCRLCRRSITEIPIQTVELRLRTPHKRPRVQGTQRRTVVGNRERIYLRAWTWSSCRTISLAVSQTRTVDSVLKKSFLIEDACSASGIKDEMGWHTELSSTSARGRCCTSNGGMAALLKLRRSLQRPCRHREVPCMCAGSSD